AKRLINDGIPLPKNLKEAKDKIVITTGSQQALFILGDILIDPGDIIITTEPVYLGFVGPMMRFGARIVTVPTDDKGAIPEYVNAAIEKAKKRFKKIPDMIYVIPDSDNPKGTTIPMNRRKALYEIAEEHKILLVEDAAYREIQFQQKVPPIKSLDKENKWVVYIRTSSKEAAVFRIGYTVLPDDILRDFLKSKGYIDLTSPIINQVLLKKYYEKYFDDVINNVVEGYRRRCNAMEAAIDTSFPPGWRSHPSGGFFIWWESDDKSFNARHFLEKVALKNDLSYVPGEAFYPLPEFGYVFNPETNCIERLKKPKRNTMRLSFSFLNEKEISEGINKLGNILSQHLKS
ncbi:MAG: PLP-dependent aminotransferase family protein, partial [Candidatus Njordarchaeum guaymaensis]